jgi:hypothetical protein
MFTSREEADNAAELGAEAIQKLMLATAIWLNNIGVTAKVTNETLLDLQRMFCDSIMPLLQPKPKITPKVIGFIQRKGYGIGSGDSIGNGSGGGDGDGDG